MATPEQIALQEALKQLTEQTTEAQLESSEKRIKQLEKEKEFLDEQAALGKTIVGRAKEAYDLDEEKLERRKLLIKLGRAELDDTKEKIKEEERLLDIKRQGYNDAEGFAKRFMGITREPSSEFGKFLVDPSARLEGLSKGLGEVVDGMSIMTSTVDKVVETTVKLALEQDQAVVSFRKATGASGEFDDNIRGLERSLFTAGVTAGEASQAVQSLFGSVTDFTQMSEQQQKVLSETVAVLNELGVSSETTAKNIQFSTKVLGQSTNQAAALQRELFTFAQDLGVSADQIANDFQSIGPTIAALGTNGVDAFRKLQVQAKSTGLALDEILGIVDQFNKFDTAAQAVGKLNALLGGPYLNTLELVAETDPAKRFEMLKDRVDDAGLSFDQMDFYQKKALASAMGLNEQQLALMMRGRLDLISEPAKSAADIEALAEQTAQFNTLADEMKQVAMGLAISFGPLISMFKDFLQLLTPVIQNLDVIVYGLGGYAVAMGIAAAATAYQTIATTGLTAAMNKNILLGGLAILLPMLASLGPVFKGIAIAIGFVTAGVLALSAAEKTTVILGVIGLVISGVAALVHAFTVGNSPSLVEAFMMVAAAVPFFGLALLGLLPILPALLLMIPPLVFGFTMLSKALTEMLSEQFVTNLQLMAIEIANIVSSINELSATKAIAFTATMPAVATAAMAMAPVAGAAAVIGAIGGGETAAPPAAGAEGGGVININLSIDGEEFKTVVNAVEVSKNVAAKESAMYKSIIAMIEQGMVKG